MRNSCLYLGVSLLLLTVTQGIRQDENAMLEPTSLEETAACTPQSCTSFEESEKCSCLQFKESEELQTRLEALFKDTLQRIRKIQDKLTENSGTFSKFWWGNSLGHAQKDLLLLDGGVQYMPKLQAMSNTVVRDLPKDCFDTDTWTADANGDQCYWYTKRPDYNVCGGADDADFTSADMCCKCGGGEQVEDSMPAGVYPIMVEIWDDNIGRNVFIGETGVPFADGTQEYVRHLKGNAYQHSVDPQDGKVTFKTEIQRSQETFPCTLDSSVTCFEMYVKVTCLKAEYLPNTDSGFIIPFTHTRDLTDAYCKVRVNTLSGAASLKFKTAVVENNLNPTFNHTFEVPAFEVPLIQAVDSEEQVPFTMDQLTLSEQIGSTMQYLATRVFLDEHKCKKSTRFQALCKIVQSVGAGAIDKKALQDLQSDDNPVVRKLAEKNLEAAIDEEKGPISSLIQMADSSEAEELDKSESGNYHHYRHRSYVVRHRRHSSGRIGGGGNSGMGPLMLFAFLCLLVLLL